MAFSSAHSPQQRLIDRDDGIEAESIDDALELLAGACEFVREEGEGRGRREKEGVRVCCVLCACMDECATVCTHVPALEGPPFKNKTSSKYRAEHVEGDGLAAGPELLDRLGAPVGVDLDLPPHMPARPPRHSCRQGRDGGD